MVALSWRTQNLRALETETVIHHLGDGSFWLCHPLYMEAWIVSVFWRRGTPKTGLAGSLKRRFSILEMAPVFT